MTIRRTGGTVRPRTAPPGPQVPLEQIDSRELPLTPELIDDLLTDDVADALGALGDGPLTISGLPSSDTADKTSSE